MFTGRCHWRSDQWSCAHLTTIWSCSSALDRIVCVCVCSCSCVLCARLYECISTRTHSIEELRHTQKHDIKKKSPKIKKRMLSGQFVSIDFHQVSFATSFKSFVCSAILEEAVQMYIHWHNMTNVCCCLFFFFLFQQHTNMKFYVTLFMCACVLCVTSSTKNLVRWLPIGIWNG